MIGNNFVFVSTIPSFAEEDILQADEYNHPLHASEELFLEESEVGAMEIPEDIEVPSFPVTNARASLLSISF